MYLTHCPLKLREGNNANEVPMDLILNIGLPKTATTAIQRLIYENEPGYYGKFMYTSASNDYARKLEALLVTSDLNDRDLASQVRLWCASLLKTHRKNSHSPTDEPVIISNEGLFHHGLPNTTDKWPVGTRSDFSRSHQRARHTADLLYLLNKHWRVGEVRVLLVLRRQPDWVASLYAQRARLMSNPSQEDFESQCIKLLTHGLDALDYNLFIQELDSANGRNKNNVLLFEELNSQAFWTKLCETLSSDTAYDRCMYKANEHFISKQEKINAKRTALDEWRIPLQPVTNFLSRNTKKLINKTETTPPLGRAPKTTIKAMQAIENSALYLTRIFNQNRRCNYIWLPPELERNFKDALFEKNTKLAARLNKDLSLHDYYER